MTHPIHVITRSAMIASAAFGLALATPAVAAPGKGMMPHHCGPAMTSRLTVTGQGEARIAPDMATIQLGVTSQADSAAEAMRQNASQQSAVIEALKGAGIADTDIQTSGLNLNPMMDYGENRAPSVTGYQASNMVAVRVSEMGSLGEVLDAIVAAGANQIDGITFGRKDGKDAEDEARRAAVADARHKAEILAEAAGVSLGQVLVIGDTQMSGGPRPMMRMAADAAPMAESIPVEAGELSVNAVVQIEYALNGGQQDCRPHKGKGKKGGKHGKDAEDADGSTAPADQDAVEAPEKDSN
ncbi:MULTISPECIES: SIMPL domain-containing protein [unclassified Paracoccus (in: a-proteobacteria)]|uniref:SIMPL domain-containing protein n=1 Tax=unclassified Paracoccus (in: a-proteobacteria) TaxID=2688777 RepID=UPI001FFE1AF0|nr:MULTISPECIES: SIMPL domain-containing protein [unclassified Paracoccus (in: a-proteobacteria)]